MTGLRLLDGESATASASIEVTPAAFQIPEVFPDLPEFSDQIATLGIAPAGPVTASGRLPIRFTCGPKTSCSGPLTLVTAAGKVPVASTALRLRVAEERVVAVRLKPAFVRQLRARRSVRLVATAVITFADDPFVATLTARRG